jgi:DNA-binding NarL/FixJ family response regulator
MLARDLFGPAADQRIHDRIAEIARERRGDEMTSPVASVTWQATRPLTIREREVLRQEATGRSNQHIAQNLNLGRKTASNPITNILRKLGGRKRTAAILPPVRVMGDG